jgi:hypothetical protein
VASPAEVESKVAAALANKRKSVLMLLNRKGVLRFVAVKPKRD